MTQNISRLNSDADANECAKILISSEPWLTFKTSYEEALQVIKDSDNETYVYKTNDGSVAGFVTITFKGSLPGYIKRIAVREDLRYLGIGKELMSFAEELILPVTKNVFLCVSDFNKSAIRFYERLGYKMIGEITNYLLEGKHELIMRKSGGPLKE